MPSSIPAIPTARLSHFVIPPTMMFEHADLGTRDVALEAGRAHWLPAQVHAGENSGSTPTHVLFVELKDVGQDASPASPVIGPS